MIGAVLFDLDDTLYPQAAWLDGAWDAVAARAAEMGVPEAPFADALRTIAAQGTDQGRIIDRALAWCGAPDVPVAPLLEAFRSHAPEQLEPYPGVREGLAKLARRVPLGIVTDGDPLVQHAKLRALGFDAMVVVFSDELGREHRKPDPAPFERALETLGATRTRDGVRRRPSREGHCRGDRGRHARGASTHRRVRRAARRSHALGVGREHRRTQSRSCARSTVRCTRTKPVTALSPAPGAMRTPISRT